MTTIAVDRLDRQRHGYAEEEKPFSPPAKRVHLTLPSALHEKIKEVQAETNADTLVEVVKVALVTYLALVKEHKRGKEIMVKDPKNGRETAYALFMNQ